MDIKHIDIEQVALAIEADAGMALAGLRESLGQAQRGEIARITTPEQLLVRAARAKVGLSQQAFAKRIKTPVATLRDWEQGRFSPSGGILCLLQLIERHPDLSEELAHP